LPPILKLEKNQLQKNVRTKFELIILSQALYFGNPDKNEFDLLY